jgi:hypothetical protein
VPVLPLLFLDVDGPLIPFGGTYPPAPTESPGSNPLLSRLNPSHGPRLLALPGDLIWATTWMADANEIISPRIGLPDLPVVEWSSSDDDPEIPGLHWKTPGLVAWAAGRPFVWIDDEITPVDRSWVRAHHPGPALLHRVDPRLGLTEPDFQAIETWLAEL